MRAAIEKMLGWALVLLFLATVVTVIYQVMGRYVLASPSSATEEIARFLLIWMGMVASAYTFARRMHVGVDIIANRFAPKMRRTMRKATWAVCALFAILVLVYGGGMLVSITMTLGQSSPALGLPMWTIYTVVPLSGVVITYYALSFLIFGAPQNKTEMMEGGL